MEEVGKRSRVHVWKDVTVVEMKRFLGLHFLTGHVKKSRLRDFWSDKSSIATPHFNRTMTFDRFEMIQRFLHFSDSELQPANTDRLFKVRHVLTTLLDNFRRCYTPDREISIDEGKFM